MLVGCEQFFRPGYVANLVSSWLPALDGVTARLEAGGRGADLGCGLGASTVLLGLAFPGSRFVGSDYDLITTFDCLHDMGDPLCIPNALSQPGGFALGAQAGEAAIRRIATDAGFTRFRPATQTPFNIL